MLYACTASLLLIVGCVLFHYEALRFVGAAAAGVRQPGGQYWWSSSARSPRTWRRSWFTR